MPPPASLSRMQEPTRSSTERPEGLLETRTTDALTYTVLLGWRRIRGPDGWAIPYSPAKAKELLREIDRFRE